MKCNMVFNEKIKAFRATKTENLIEIKGSTCLLGQTLNKVYTAAIHSCSSDFLSLENIFMKEDISGKLSGKPQNWKKCSFSLSHRFG